MPTVPSPKTTRVRSNEGKTMRLNREPCKGEKSVIITEISLIQPEIDKIIIKIYFLFLP